MPLKQFLLSIALGGSIGAMQAPEENQGNNANQLVQMSSFNEESPLNCKYTLH
jgi:hypothetical protein